MSFVSTWNVGTGPDCAYPYIALSTGTKAVIGCYNKNYCITSADGIAWAAVTLPATGLWTRGLITSAGTVILAGAGSTAVLARSTDDAASFSSVTLPGRDASWGITFEEWGGRLIAVASTNVSGPRNSWYSLDDGATWSVGSLMPVGGLFQLEASNDIVLGFRYNTTEHFKSTDGMVTTVPIASPQFILNVVRYDPFHDRFIGIGGSGQTAYLAGDGTGVWSTGGVLPVTAYAVWGWTFHYNPADKAMYGSSYGSREIYKTVNGGLFWEADTPHPVSAGNWNAMGVHSGLQYSYSEGTQTAWRAPSVALTTSGGGVVGGTFAFSAPYTTTLEGGGIGGGEIGSVTISPHTLTGGAVGGGTTGIITSALAEFTLTGGGIGGGESVLVTGASHALSGGGVGGGTISLAPQINDEPFLFELFDDDEVPITGASPTIKIYREADGFFFDFYDLVFKSSGWVTIVKVMTAADIVNWKSAYRSVVDVAPFDRGRYVAIFEHSGTPLRNGSLGFLIANSKVADTYLIAQAEANAAAIDDKMPTSHIDATGGKVDGVALVDVTTTNTDMRGTDGANTITPDNAGIGANGVAIASVGAVADQVLLDTGTALPLLLASILEDTADMQPQITTLRILAMYKHVLSPVDGTVIIYDTNGIDILYSGFAYSDEAGTVLYNGTAAVHHTSRLV